jgi:methylthioribose-1-phosphate isomerase
MKIHGQHHRTIRLRSDTWSVEVIDQTLLPHKFETVSLTSVEDAARAIHTMQVRGAPLIGATAAYGVALAMRRDPSNAALEAALHFLAKQRPTAVNLQWALEQMRTTLLNYSPARRAAAAYARAGEICDEDVETCRQIGVHGLSLIKEIAAQKAPGEPVNILTHCNAGWLACVDWGTATSPIYQAHDAGIAVHVWVDETRPRNQGAFLTAYELGAHGVPHTIIVDNAGGHYMQAGAVDLVIVGTDRVTRNGDVANKIGTYLKALAARDTGLPFYVALPFSTIDWNLDDGRDIPIEERSPAEVTAMTGRLATGAIVTVDIAAPGSPAANPAFDVTPARLVTGFITERGVCEASTRGLLSLYPERATPAQSATMLA